MHKADTLLINGAVLTMDDRHTIHFPGAVAVTGNSITAVGPADEIQADYEAAEVIDCAGKIIMPGLINAHTHVPMTLLRGLADDLRLDVWLLGYIMPAEREFVNPEFVRLGTSLACAEMISSGITTFADMYYFEEVVAEAAAEAGMRALAGQSVLMFPTPDAESSEKALERARAFIQKWKGHELIVPGVAPHAPYTTTPEIIRACTDLALEFDVPLQMHIAEMTREQEDSLRDNGSTVVPWLNQIGMFEAKVLAAHCVHIDEADMRLLKRTGCGAAHCPTSNLKLASGIAPITQMLHNGLNVGIGTDGPASNNDLDMVEEVRLAAILAKTASNDPRSLPARQALDMATRLGAKALHMDDITGTLETGKRADVIVLDMDGVHARPRFERDPDAVYAQVVYASKSTDVLHVMCNGQWLLRERAHQTLDTERLAREAEALARRVDTFMAERVQSVLHKLFTIGGVDREESFEVQVKGKLSDPELVTTLLKDSRLTIVKHSHYRQFDTYFFFDPQDDSRLRYREDDFVDEAGRTTEVRSRLTLMGPASEHAFEGTVVLSRSRFISSAESPLRFYREYFEPAREIDIIKERRRWHVEYEGLLFYINLDRFEQPAWDAHYLEIKSRTWSEADAERKAAIILKLVNLLGEDALELIEQEYVEMAL